MGDRLQMLKDMGINLYGLGENVASLGSAAIAEPVAGFAAMYDPVNGAQAIREGMTYHPRGDSAKMYQKGVGDFVSKLVKPVMPAVETWQKGVDIAGRYSPAAGAALATAPTALAALLGYKPAMQTGRQVSNGLDMLQRRVVANASAPRTLNTGFRGQRGAANFDYRDSHRAPRPQDNGAAHALNDIYPDDIYSANAQRYYGTGDPYDKKTFQIINSLRNNPDKKITIYRAIPDDINADINDGDWVSLTPEYAKAHGDSRFDGKYKILTKEVSAKELHNNGDSIHEWGYNPVQTTHKRPLTEFEQAHLTAQRNAALPVNQGGLGLAPDNTAMDRAKAMGFDTDVYHGTGADIDSFDMSKVGSNIVLPVNAPRGIYTAKDAEIASRYSKGDGSNVIPLIQKSSGAALNNSKIMATLDPSSIRSRFAAFDPFNRDSSNLLAQSAKLAPSAGIAAYLYGQQNKDKQ